jgi:hypothetical protein
MANDKDDFEFSTFVPVTKFDLSFIPVAHYAISK